MLLHFLLPGLFRALSRCSLPTLHRLGGWVGLATYWASPRYRRRLQANMHLGLGRTPRRAELWANAQETGRMLFELPFIWLRPQEEVLTYVEIRGIEHLDALRAEGLTMIALTPHLGGFEIAPQFVGSVMPMTVLYRPPKQSVFEPIQRAGRERGQITLMPTDTRGVRSIIKGLRQGIATGLLPDQAPSTGEGLWAPFFGRPAYTMTLAARLSEMKNTRLLFFWSERLRGRGWRLHICAPQAPIDGTLETRVAAINREIEHLIRQQPTQYLWAYNRYKTPAGAPRPPAFPSTDS